MKFYLAGGEGFVEELKKVKAHNILTSYFYLRKKEPTFLINKESYWNIFLDCGAFSAWTQGVPIDVHEYGKFLQKYGHLVNVYPNLDVKGNITQTQENQKILEEEYGVHPIPVFHVNTRRWDILEGYIEKYPYIALGAIAGENTPTSTMDSDLNNIFSRVKRNPLTKFHGFGVASLQLVSRYPFYSVDSTSWLAGGRFGTLYGKLDLTKKSLGKTKNQEVLSKALGYKDMMRRNVMAFQQLEKDITYMWKMRGIEWID